MGRALFSFLLRLDSLLIASASKLLLPPIPTQAGDGAFAGVQHPATTAAPEYYASAELLGRRDYDMGHDTCGFGALDSAITYKCYSSIGTCENIGDYRGCCTGGLKACSSTFWTQCDDYDPTSVCGLMSHTRCCQSALPYCITWLFSTSDTTLTAWDCDSQIRTRTFELLATPLSLISSTSTTSPTIDASWVSISPLGTSESTSLPFATSDSAAASSTAAVTSSAGGGSAPTNNGSATPVGAIVGGVVGGVAVIALIVFGILFLKRYQRQDPKAPAPPPTPPGPQELLGSGIPPPNPPPGQASYVPVPQYDFTGQPKYQEPMAQISPVEVPNTPAAGTGYNRAELA